jgi:hypothetical protein
MTPEEIEIARAFVACGHWRWMPGMLTGTGYRALRVDSDLTWGVCQDEQTDQEPWPFAYDWLPDLDDPATLGCVRRVVVDVWRCVDWDLAQAGSTRWHFGFVTPEGEDFEFQGSTEAEALLRALQAAPEVAASCAVAQLEAPD